MFTGLVETTGSVRSAARRAGSLRLAIAARLSGETLRPGESISVDGVCLTLSRARGGVLEFDVVRETLERTTLGGLRPGDAVNLERSLRPADRVGGHFVLGHVDATAAVRSVRRRAGDHRLAVALAPAIRPYVAEKGSIAVQGVSLTVARLGRADFEVALVPETLRRTTLGSLRPGDRVNVEVDPLARYLEALIRERFPQLRPPGQARGLR